MTIPARMQRRLGWRVAFCLLLAFPALVPTQTLAQAYPSKPVHIVVPFAAGGAVDVVARAVGQQMSAQRGVRELFEGLGARVMSVTSQNSPPA